MRRSRQQAGGRPRMQQMEPFPGFESRSTTIDQTTVVTVTPTVSLRRRSESAPVPHHTGPISHATGGPLNAEESERVVRGRSIRIAGWWWPESGGQLNGVIYGPRAVCKPCFDEDPKMADDEPARFGLGYRRPLWSEEYRGGLSCTYCFQRIRP